MYRNASCVSSSSCQSAVERRVRSAIGRGPGLTAAGIGLSLLMAMSGGVANAQVEIRPVVTSGDPAPGLAGGVSFSVPLLLNTFDNDPFGFAIADDGTVAFRAPLQGVPIDTSNDFSLWTAAPDGTLSLLLREGDAAPGTAAGVTINQLSLTTMSPTGRVLVAASVAGPGVDISNFVGFWAVEDGVFDAPLRTGDPAADAPLGSVFQTFDRLPTQNRVGGLALPAAITGPGIDTTNGQGVWWGNAPTSLDASFRAGDAVPGQNAVLAASSPALALGVPVITDSGSVVALRALSGAGVTSSNNRLIAAFTDTGTTTIARLGDAAPGGGSFVRLDPPSVSNTGAVAFTAGLTGSSGGGQSAVFVYNGATFLTRLVQGDAIPGGPGGFTFDVFSSVTVNASGEVAVRASANPAGPSREVLWTDAGVSPSLVAISGEDVPGTPGATFGAFGRPIVTDTGAVVFSATDTDTGARGVYHYSSQTGQLTTMLREGQVIDLDPTGSDQRTVLTLTLDDRGPEVSVNAGGEVAVRVSWVQGGASILVVSPETCAGDFDGNGTANVFDIIAFLGAWSMGDDFNGDGATNIFDIIEFLGVWNQGCP